MAVHWLFKTLGKDSVKADQTQITVLSGLGGSSEQREMNPRELHYVTIIWLGEINTAVHQAGMQVVETWAQMSFWLFKLRLLMRKIT